MFIDDDGLLVDLIYLNTALAHINTWLIPIVLVFTTSMNRVMVIMATIWMLIAARGALDFRRLRRQYGDRWWRHAEAFDSDDEDGTKLFIGLFSVAMNLMCLWTMVGYVY